MRAARRGGALQGIDNMNHYDYYVVLSHCKGHTMAGFGGAIKNITIGIASSKGKSHIHSGGKGRAWSSDQDGLSDIQK